MIYEGSLISRLTKRFIDNNTPDYQEHNVKFSFETKYRPKSKEELNIILEEWNQSNDVVSKWDDLGFSIEKEPSNIYWLNKSIATNEFKIPLLESNRNIIQSESLISWLDRNKNEILLLENKIDY